MPGDEPGPDVREAVRKLLKATEEYTRAYGVWSVDPHRWNELRDAERRLEDARRTASEKTARPEFRQP